MGRLFTVDSGTGINIFALLLFLVINAYNDEVKSQTRLFFCSPLLFDAKLSSERYFLCAEVP